MQDLGYQSIKDLELFVIYSQLAVMNLKMTGMNKMKMSVCLLTLWR